MSDLALPRSFESEICGICGASLYARRPRSSDGISGATGRDVVIACVECDTAHCCLDADNPMHVEEIEEAQS